MKVSIRQLNGCLSAMQVARINPKSQTALKELIQTLIKGKKDYIEMPAEDTFCKAIVEMSALHTNLIRVQRHNEIQKHSIHHITQNKIQKQIMEQN